MMAKPMKTLNIKQNVHVKHLYKQILLRSALHGAGEARAPARC